MYTNIILLILSTIIWGFGFVGTRWTLIDLDPLWSMAFRFLVAAILGMPFLLYRKTFFKKENHLKEALLASTLVFTSLLCQTIGLNQTTIAKSGFITTLYVFFVPLFSMIILKKRYRWQFWSLVICSMIGMALLCNLEIGNLVRGDFWTVICAMCFALHIMYIGKLANSIKAPLEFNFLQNFFVAIFSVIAALIYHPKTNLSFLFIWNSKVLWGVMFLGIFSSMVAFSIQIIAQKKIPVHIVGLIFLMESPFAAIFGYFCLGEKLNAMNLLGAFLIIMSVILVPFLGREVTAIAPSPH